MIPRRPYHAGLHRVHLDVAVAHQHVIFRLRQHERKRLLDKREVLSFEGWETQTEAATRKLYGQLRDIDGNRDFPAALRIPAASL